MEPEGSLPCIQVPVSCPYPEPYQSTACHPFHLLKIHLNITTLWAKWNCLNDTALYNDLLLIESWNYGVHSTSTCAYLKSWTGTYGHNVYIRTTQLFLSYCYLLLDVINFKCMAHPHFSTGKVLSACLVALPLPQAPGFQFLLSVLVFFANRIWLLSVGHDSHCP